MRINTWSVTAACLLSLAGGLAGCATTRDVDEAERSVTLDQLPPAVRATAERMAAFGNGTIQEIEIETEDGLTVYEVQIGGPGGEIEVEIAPDGTILEVEFEDDDEGDDEDDDEDDDEGDDDDEDEGDGAGAAPGAGSAVIVK